MSGEGNVVSTLMGDHKKIMIMITRVHGDCEERGEGQGSETERLGWRAWFFWLVSPTRGLHLFVVFVIYLFFSLLFGIFTYFFLLSFVFCFEQSKENNKKVAQ